MILAQHVSTGYGDLEVIHDLTFEIKEKGIYVLLGKNGAGKTTILRLLAGVLKPWKGLFRREGSIAYLPHYIALPPEMRVKEALDFLSRILNANYSSVIEELDLKDLLGKKISDLSQGQKKRVSLSRVFMREKDIYLLDEPTDNLDPVFASKVREKVVSLSKSKIVIYTSHNLYEAKEIGKYVMVMDNGRLIRFCTMDELRTGEYVVGIRASSDLSKILEGHYEGDYFVVKLPDPSMVNEVIQKLLRENITIYEVKEMRNPLEELLR
ncbi:ATP-binding cassette domain-containing protein [Sulfolobus acidocaldarius]|uniref:ABC transporter n=4 Tax=Sulfolobus acidocaldarius TaxID=2285 RepID=Q4JAR7_SULAC|nr:ABC transporter ATP-binding protein [Sulfolobus acidocaldarius]AAY80112.1 ABC transporter [Sulfolobus acidocaldarius DSM 639]AGE70686.1 ABC transporter [Sulfolobus acidocaldarius N8]AGE72958.1 ABC transporter [Sulfolobus acidocaldarius Ron12/I]ALU28974.1 heme ABC transporter [Sulfolobus acidocaldarius]ALU31701.1 heme ABC transporter [Sulfolobus acidocaldarius]